MNPVQPPHDISGKVKRGTTFPIVIHIIAQFLDKLGHKMRRRRLVLALSNFDPAWPKNSGIRTQSIERFPVQRAYQRRPQLEIASLDGG